MAFDESNAGNPSDKTKMRPKNEQYFASKEPKDCASVLLNKASTFFNVWRTNEYIDKMKV
jgi:hypothetical protein